MTVPELALVRPNTLPEFGYDLDDAGRNRSKIQNLGVPQEIAFLKFTGVYAYLSELR